MKPVISIIVPAYKVEKYLDRCLSSIKKQSYRNYECIVVDDGSPDKCGEIADRYHEEDSRFRVIHQENAGLSDARNNAMKTAEGDIIAFVDSDDWVLPRMFETMLGLMQKYNADIVMCDYLSERGSFYDNIKNKEPIIEYTGRAFTEEVLKDTIGSQLWKFIYKKELWEGIISPSRRHAQDMMILHQVTNRSNKVVVTSDKLYGYNDTRDDNISNNKKNTIKNHLDRALAFWNRVDFCIDNEFSEDIQKAIINQALFFSVNAFSSKEILEDKFDDDVNTIRSYLRKYWHSVRKWSSRKDYIVRCWMIKTNMKLYINLYCIKKNMSRG